MAKGQMRSNKEKKKPKQDKNKKNARRRPVTVRRPCQPVQARHEPLPARNPGILRPRGRTPLRDA